MPYQITKDCTGCGACKKVCVTNAISGERKQLHSIDARYCVDCGACGKICPDNSVQNQYAQLCQPLKRSQWPKPVIDLNTCCSCVICIDACPVGCLALGEPTTGKFPRRYPLLKDPRSCVGCHFCAIECPVDSISMHADL